MPVAADEISIYSEVSGSLYSYVITRDNPSASTLVCDVKIFGGDGRLVAEVRGLVMRPALAAASALATECLFEERWIPSPLPETPTVDIAGIATKLNGQIISTLRNHRVDTYGDLKIELDRACADAIFNALVSLGFSSGITAHPTDLAKQLGVVDRYQSLLERFLAILVEDRILRRDANQWVIDRLPPASTNTFGELTHRFPAFANEIGFAKRCAPHLAHILIGETNPMQVLFPNGSTVEAEALYSESASARAYNSMVRDAVQEIAACRKSNAPFRILEIGAGTGGTTTFLAPALDPESTEYTFTDISPAFVAKAQERFRPYKFLRYGVLDLEQDPRAQSFAKAHYDLILATNCVHATADLGQSLAHIGKLLSPGGVLILTEMTKPERWVDLSFGLTEGWWRFTDRALRPKYPLLSAEHWVETLRAQGFVPATPIVSPDNSNAILISAKDPVQIGDWLVVSDAQGVGDEFATLLSGHVRSCTKIRFDALQPDMWTRTWQGLVILSALDAAPFEALTNSNIDQAQELVCRRVLEFVQNLQKAPAQFVLVTRGAQSVHGDDVLSPAQGTVWGFARSLAEERPEFHCRIIDLDPRESAKNSAERLLEEVLDDSSQECAWRNGGRFCNQLVHASPRTPLHLSVTTRGSIDNLEFELAHRKFPAPSQVEIAVTASGVNFRDVLNVLGLYPGDPGPLGGECAGTIVAVGTGVSGWKTGDEVVALASGAHDGFVLADEWLIARKPRTLSHEEAAGLAISFLTAHYTLHHLGRLKAGDRVLIHAAAGGVGLAAVQLALRAGTEVFATAGSESKRAYLRSLGVSHVFDSRSAAFAAEIRRITNGRGVDVVLNSLANEIVDASFEITAVGGRFLEIGKRGIWSDAQVSALNKSISYHVIDWGEIAPRNPDLIGGMLREIMVWAERGEIQPLPTRVWNYSDAKQALRFMAQARHIGKIVLRQPGSPFTVRDKGLYVITGGFGALGIKTAKWLFAEGARNFALIGRSKPSDFAAQDIAAMRLVGARVRELVDNLTDYNTLSSAIDWGSVRGIIHSAGHLADGLLSQLDWAKFREPQHAKVDGTLTLHHLSADSPLDFFVLYSSVASITGGVGQANHAAANSFEDAFALTRRAQGLPATSINWGAWSGLGAAVRDPELERRRARTGLKTITVGEGFELLDHILRANHAHVIAARVDWDTYASQSHRPARWLSNVTKKAPAGLSTAQNAPGKSATMSESAAPARLSSIDGVREHVQQLARRILGFTADRHIQPKQPLQELGLDSLMAVEFRNALAASLGQHLPSTLLFNCPAIEDIAQYVATEVLTFTPAVSKSNVEDIPSGLALVNEIEDLSDEEVDRLLAGRTVTRR
jgi:NADPH:quinone reductase-like Zn-dependent oxidoreductase/SAM-dependent methyltransferase/acyl carrier protein